MLGSSQTTGAVLVPLEGDFRHLTTAQLWMGLTWRRMICLVMSPIAKKLFSKNF